MKVRKWSSWQNARTCSGHHLKQIRTDLEIDICPDWKSISFALIGQCDIHFNFQYTKPKSIEMETPQAFIEFTVTEHRRRLPQKYCWLLANAANANDRCFLRCSFDEKNNLLNRHDITLQRSVLGCSAHGWWKHGLMCLLPAPIKRSLIIIIILCFFSASIFCRRKESHSMHTNTDTLTLVNAEYVLLSVYNLKVFIPFCRYYCINERIVFSS